MQNIGPCSSNPEPATAMNLTKPQLFAVILLVLFMTVLTGFWIHFQMKSLSLAKINDRILSVERQLEKENKNLTEESERYEQLKAGAKQKEELEAANQALEVENEAQRRKLSQRVSEWETAKINFRQTIDAVVKKTNTTPIPVVSNTGGEPYRDCKISAIVDGDVRLEHSTGTARLPFNRLPPELAQITMVDWRPRLNLPKHPFPTEAEVAMEKRLIAAEPQEPAEAAPVDDSVNVLFKSPSNERVRARAEALKRHIYQIQKSITDALNRRSQFEVEYDKWDRATFGSNSLDSSSLAGNDKYRDQRASVEKFAARSGYQAMNRQIQSLTRTLKEAQNELRKLLE